MAKIAGFAAAIVVLLAVAAVMEAMDLLHVTGPDLPQWSYRPISLFLAGFIVSLAVIAFRMAEGFVERGHLHRQAAGNTASSSGVREIKCQNPDCKTVNRVRSYSVRQIPYCSKCGEHLPEPVLMHIARFGYVNPSVLVAAGAAAIILGFFFLDRYLPRLGLVWNAINGTIGGFPYRYVLAIGVVIILLGLIIATRNKRV